MHGAGPHDDRVGGRAQTVHQLPGIGVADPAARSVARPKPSVDGQGQLQRHVGQPGGAMVQIGPVQVPSSFFQHAGLDRHTLAPKELEATTVDALIGIGMSDHDAAYACCHDRRRAGWHPALVHAGLEVDVESGSRSVDAFESEGFRMRRTCARVDAFRKDLAIEHQHRSDPWIGRGPDRPARELDGSCHVALVGSGHMPSSSPLRGMRRTAASESARRTGTSSSIRTVTVGPGIPPGRPESSGSRTVTAGRGLHPAPKRLVLLRCY